MYPWARCPEVLSPLDECIKIAPPGHFVEFGVAGGHSLRKLAAARPGQTIGLDTFEGLPERWRDGFEVGSFSQDGAIPDVPGAECRKGLFADLTPNLHVPCALMHVDCDLYQGAKEALNWFSRHKVSCAIVVFDEIFGYPGFEWHELKAYMEEVGYPHRWIYKSDPEGCKAAFQCL